ncbi:MAG: sigma-70 family RNA polymerase sigma factor [Chloroflexota bacterium]
MPTYTLEQFHTLCANAGLIARYDEPPEPQIAADDLDGLAWQAKNGPPDARLRLWEAVQPLIRPLIKHYAGGDALLEPDDITQEAYHATHLAVSAWPGEGQFQAWLLSHLRWHLLAVRRRATHYDQPHDVGQLPPLALITIPDPEPVEAIVTARELLRHLHPADQTLLLAYIGEERPIREASAVAGIAKSTAANRIPLLLAFLAAVAETGAGDRPPDPRTLAAVAHHPPTQPRHIHAHAPGRTRPPAA